MNDASGNRSVRNPQDLARQLVFREQAGDVVGMATLYERDAILDIGDGHVVRGRDAIQAFYADLVATDGGSSSLRSARPSSTETWR